jgi:hypothetical protein
LKNALIENSTLIRSASRPRENAEQFSTSHVRQQQAHGLGCDSRPLNRVQHTQGFRSAIAKRCLHMDIRNTTPRRVFTAAVLATTLLSGSVFACLCTTGTIIVKKFYDANANGIHDPGEVRLSGWPMTLGATSLGVRGTLATDAFGYAQFSGVAIGTDYTMTEAMPIQGNWVQSAPTVNGVPINPIVGIKVHAGQTTQLTFGNYCTKPSGGRTPGFWSNKNGHAMLLDGAPSSLLPELNLLANLNLVRADGGAFNPIDYPSFRSWLLGSDATNMAYKLSQHLAAMSLNIEAGLVNGNRVYAPYGGTVNQLVAAANVSLGAFPSTPAGHPQRANQERLKDFLDALNNGAGVVNPTPCARTFVTSSS